MTTPTEKLCNLLHVEELDTLLFRGVTPAENQLPRVFGGQVLAQSLNAAIRTVPEKRLMHSLHAYFLRPGDINRPILFEVDPIRDGGSFTTRRVVAKQNGKAIFNTAISFKEDEDGLEHQMAMPTIPAPEELQPDRERLQQFLDHHPDMEAPSHADAFGCFETRSTGEIPFLRSRKDEPVQGLWLKTRQPLPTSQPLHHALLAYASDFRLMSTALLPHGVIYQQTNLQAASLDHAMWVHAPFRIDDWLYYHMEAPVASGGRGLNTGRFYNREGHLVATVTQEGLMRLR